MGARKTRRKKNAGWFKKGADPRRHKLTREESARGYTTTMMGGKNYDLPAKVILYIHKKVRGIYRKKGSWNPRREWNEHGR